MTQFGRDGLGDEAEGFQAKLAKPKTDRSVAANDTELEADIQQSLRKEMRGFHCRDADIAKVRIELMGGAASDGEYSLYIGTPEGEEISKNLTTALNFMFIKLETMCRPKGAFRLTQNAFFQRTFNADGGTLVSTLNRMLDSKNRLNPVKYSFNPPPSQNIPGQ